MICLFCCTFRSTVNVDILRQMQHVSCEKSQVRRGSSHLQSCVAVLKHRSARPADLTCRVAECHKSSRGDAALAASTCGYDGRGSVSKQTGKRARGHSDEAENAKSKTSKVSAGSNAAKSKSSGAQGEGAPDGGKGRVASLMERICTCRYAEWLDLSC